MPDVMFDSFPVLFLCLFIVYELVDVAQSQVWATRLLLGSKQQF